jgi:hypothetical protein
LESPPNFQRWEAEKRGKFDDVPDLASQLRPRIDALSSDLLSALATVGPFLEDAAVRDAIRKRATDVLTGDGITQAIRDTALQPLVALPAFPLSSKPFSF